MQELKDEFEYTKLIKKLREETGCGMSDARNALSQCDLDYNKAFEKLKPGPYDKVISPSSIPEQKSLISSYVHLGKIGVLVQVQTQSEVTTRLKEVQIFADELAQQISFSDQDLLNQDSIHHSGKKISEVLQDLNILLKEKISISKFIRWEA